MLRINFFVLILSTTLSSISCKGEAPLKVCSIYLNVKDYGVFGDGKTDDTQAIQKVLDHGDGKTIFFPKGNYIISKSLVILSGTEILGEGDVGAIAGSSFLSKGGISNFATFTAQENILSDVIFRNIRTLKTKYSISVNVNGGYLTKVKWYNCVFQEHEICINVTGSKESGMYANMFRDCYFKSSGLGIYCEGSFNINIIQGCGFENMINGYVKLNDLSTSNLSNSFIENRCESVTNSKETAIILSKRTFGFYMERNYFENSFSTIFKSNGAKNVSFCNNVYTNSNPKLFGVLEINGGSAIVKNNISLTGFVLNVSQNGFCSELTSNNFLNFSPETKKADLGVVNNIYNTKYNNQ